MVFRLFKTRNRIEQFLIVILVVSSLVSGFWLWPKRVAAEGLSVVDAEPEAVLLGPVPNRNSPLPALMTLSEEALVVQPTTIISATTVRRSRNVNSQPPTPDPRLELLKHIPQLIGVSEPRTYLVLIQNNDELRGTGGFISAIGQLTVHRGRIISFTIEDSYAVDDFTQPYPDAPDPLFRFMKAEIWLARDANWSPDFPTSAQNFIDLYRISRKVEIDGVIAVDQFALQYVVQAFEPVQVPNWSEPATGENVIRLIRQNWSPDPNLDFQGWDAEWSENRKNFMGDLAGALQQRVTLDPVGINWWKALNTALAALNRRHVQVWLSDPTLQSFIVQQGWDGAIHTNTDDFLMVIETNFGFNKANAIVDTALQYEVTLAETDLSQAKLTVTHQNRSPEREPCQQHSRYGRNYQALINRCYWNYLRVYTPFNSRLLETTPHAVPGEALIDGQDVPAQVDILSEAVDKAVWGTFLLVPHGETVDTTFQYQLPNDLIKVTDLGQHYRLDIQKQAGTWANHLHVTIHLPQGHKLIRATPQPTQIKDNELIYQMSLQTDQQIDVIFEKDYLYTTQVP